jgi:hypothetical protein
VSISTGSIKKNSKLIGKTIKEKCTVKKGKEQIG